ncbi:hypothetical protein QAD02_023091 [Eretmocerus hayati]|uniref:Uncharacterized protein n=1 Tax=Eretmocerus hayati TaxID=131215 RepID=A0ACC2PY77_9HYME|nr:hypothetical protein QAD02_023091 [Eretmocerus hayati]
MDMLQLFASPAGRALIGATREQQQQRANNRGSTSTSSLSREAASNTSRGSTSSAASSSNSACMGTISKPAKARTRRATSSTTALAGKKHCRRLAMSAPNSPQQRRSSAELYQEAVEILGLTCTLSDSCRCLDCQSSYFDYEEECDCETRPELAAGTPVLLDHALTHPMACSIQ